MMKSMEEPEGGRGLWYHCHFNGWLMSDIMCMTQPTPYLQQSCAGESTESEMAHEVHST